MKRLLASIVAAVALALAAEVAAVLGIGRQHARSVVDRADFPSPVITTVGGARF